MCNPCVHLFSDLGKHRTYGLSIRFHRLAGRIQLPAGEAWTHCKNRRRDNPAVFAPAEALSMIR